ncbi:MAG TPA: YgiQ family radical SAM protein [Planctomycetes bacterium]|nr:YgiQ family radical SAM protein [Planctomycetota bacterium]
MTRQEMSERGWDEVDVVLVSGDAYVDHPSFGLAVVGRVLEEAGFRVAVLAQPDWHSCEPWREFGRPRLFFGVGAGNMDSMINHYTANKKVRNDDAYSPGGRIGLRPDRATLAYCQRSREAYKGVPVVAGAVEASLRRLAHFDYWSEKVRASILLDAKADLIVYGMAETTIVEVAQRLQAGQPLEAVRDLRGLVYPLGAKDPRPEGPDVELLPSFEQVKEDKRLFARATKQIYLNSNPHNAKTLVQAHGKRAVVQTPPALPLSTEDMDRIHDLPFTRRPHPRYGEPIPAFEVVKHSVQIMRGCFGGCTFCSITTHQGRIIQSRSEDSVLRELEQIASEPDFKGTVSDIGGPTANMYRMRCTKPEVEAVCKRLSCVHPRICKLLGTDHGPLIQLMRKARAVPGVKRVNVASGVRIDLAGRSPEYLRELATHHVGGRLKVAPEHTDETVLEKMKKPQLAEWDRFVEEFHKASRAAGKRQELVPYFISSHPGSDLRAMIDLALFLKRNGYAPDQVQDFIPAPMDVATAMYYTGLDPLTGEEVHVARGLRDRRLQRALLQFFKPENYFLVREALKKAGRLNLMGDHCDALIPSQPPREALEARRQRANREVAGASGDIHEIRAAKPGKQRQGKKRSGQGRRRDDRRDERGGNRGYRPKRKGKPKR